MRTWHLHVLSASPIIEKKKATTSDANIAVGAVHDTFSSRRVLTARQLREQCVGLLFIRMVLQLSIFLLGATIELARVSLIRTKHQYAKCLTAPSLPFDIAIIGAPIDTAVSYRVGARSCPRATSKSSA